MRVPLELERRMADAAQVLMDLARQATALDPEAMNASADVMQAASLSTAIQAVFMADLLAQPGSVQGVAGEQLMGLFRGLGLGAGNCIGALEHGPTRSLAFGMVIGSCERGLKGRVESDAAESAGEMLTRVLRGERP